MPNVLVLRRRWNDFQVVITSDPCVIQLEHRPTGVTGRLLVQPSDQQAPAIHPRGTILFFSGCLGGYRATAYLYRQTD